MAVTTPQETTEFVQKSTDPRISLTLLSVNTQQQIPLTLYSKRVGCRFMVQDRVLYRPRRPPFVTNIPWIITLGFIANGLRFDVRRPPTGFPMARMESRPPRVQPWEAFMVIVFHKPPNIGDPCKIHDRPALDAVAWTVPPRPLYHPCPTFSPVTIQIAILLPTLGSFPEGFRRTSIGLEPVR